MPVPAFGLNRFAFGSIDAFAADVRRAEDLGWDHALIPDSQLRRRDTYVMLAGAAQATERIGLGVLIANPVNRHPTVTASSIATVGELAPGRMLLGMGAGDTAVRLAGMRPARVAELEGATRLIRSLLRGESVDVGAPDPASLPFAVPVPVWVAAGGRRTLRAAGRVADGAFIRVGTAEANLRASVDAVHEGAREAGRDPAELRLGAVFHTIVDDDADRALLIGKAMAAGYYEYSPQLFEPLGLTWDGPPVEQLKETVRPDFHHTRDHVGAGRMLDFLPERAADDFCLRGTPEQIADQLCRVLSLGIDFDIVILQPIPDPAISQSEGGRAYMETVARKVLPRVRRALA